MHIQVIGVCRQASEELKGLGIHKVIEGVDIGSAEGVARLPAQLDAGVKIDNLWLNAGIGIGIEDSLEVRHVAGWLARHVASGKEERRFVNTISLSLPLLPVMDRPCVAGPGL